MKIAIVRGSADTLKELGMGFITADADAVIEVPTNRNHYVDIPGAPEFAIEGEQYCEVVWAEVDPPEQVFVECMSRIKEAWECTFPEDSHLGHAAQGLWFSYWLSPQLEPISRLLTEGRVSDLRASAADFIAAEFGNLRGPQLQEQVA